MSNLAVSILIKAIDQATAPIRAITANFEKFRAAKSRADEAFDFSAKAGLAANAMKDVSHRAAQLVETPVDIAEGFEHAMTRASVKIGSTSDELKQLSDMAKLMGTTTRYSANEAADGMEQLGQAGFDTKQILATLPDVLDLAANDDLGMGRAAYIASTTLHGFGLDVVKDMRHLSNVIAKTANATDTTISEMGESFSYVSGAARALNVTVDQTSAMLGVLADNSVKGTRAGTALHDVFTRLAAPHPLGVQQLAALGVATKDAHHNLLPLEQILSNIEKKTKNLGTADKQKALWNIFGQEASVPAGNLMRSAASGELQKRTADLGNLNGYAHDQATQMMGDTAGSSKRLSGTIEVGEINLGEKVLPLVKQLKIELAGAITSLSAFADQYPNVAKDVLIGVAALAVFTGAMAGLLLTVSATSSTLGVLAIAFGSTQTGVQILGGGLRWLGKGLFSLMDSFGGVILKAGRLALTFTIDVVEAMGAVMIKTGQLIAKFAVELVASMAKVIIQAGRLAWAFAVELGEAIGATLIGKLAKLVVMFHVDMVVALTKVIARTAVVASAFAVDLVVAFGDVILQAGRAVFALGVDLAGSLTALLAPVARVVFAFAVDLFAAMGKVIIQEGLLAGALLIDLVAAMGGVILEAGVLVSALAVDLVAAMGTVVTAAVGAGGLGGAFAALSVAVEGFGLALLATPVGWIVAALYAIGFASYQTYTHWDEIKVYFRELWKDIVSGARTLAADLVHVIAGAVEKLSPILDGLFGKDVVDGWISGLDEVAKKVDASRHAATVATFVGAVAGAEPDEPTRGSTNTRPFVATLPVDPTRARPFAATPPPSQQAARPFPATAPEARLRPPQSQRVDGELHVKIDSEGRPRVKSLRSSGMHVSVDTGYAMGSQG